MTNKCNTCGLCCKIFYINLSKKEYLSGEYKTIFGDEENISNFNLARDCGANLLSKKDDNSCIYLENKLCSIHLTRPKVCRGFYCSSKSCKYKGMNELVTKEKTIF